jgi:GGDEF domain-containing protein
LLTQVTGEEELAARAMQIAAAVHSLRFSGRKEGLSVTVSVGGSLCADGADWAIWYSDTDTALYEAKAKGGDGVHIAVPTAQQPDPLRSMP